MERLQKYMAECGVASRRKSEELILAGKVKVNGKVVKELGIKVSEKDEDSLYLSPS
jgi:23S rRNA pseudouridine2605 synthase